jgi:ribosome biogenesis protein Nip4
MRVLTEEETQVFFEKLAKYLGSNIKFLIDREDGEYVFRLHRERIYYLNAEVLKMASHVGKDELLSAGVIFGKFTKFLWAVACAIATSLPITGTMIWLNKRKKKRDSKG